MKCKACGYEYDWNTENNKPFIQLNVEVTIDREENYGNVIERVGLYACPECKTVILND